MHVSNLKNSMLRKGLVVSAEKGFGKTNALMVLVSELKATPIVIDYCTQHAFKLGSQFEVKFLSERYWHKPKIQITNPIILDFSQTSKTQAGQILRDIIKREYLLRVKAVILGFRQGKSREEVLKGFNWLVFCLEESQDLIGRYLKQDDDLATAMNCGRNYKITFVYLTQRIADLNTSLVERCSYLIGKHIGDNNLRKISRILGISRKKLKFVETLPRGEFVFYEGNGIEKIQFPKFLGFGRAYEFSRRIIKRKPRGLWQKMRDSFKPKLEPNHCHMTEQSIDEEEDEIEEIDFVPMEDF